MPTTKNSIAEELRALDRMAPLLEALAAEIRPGEGVYVVGGTVRDILLHEDGFDVDLVVEGDAIGLGRRLAARLGGSLTAHEGFGTAVVHYGDARHVDLATARTERYPGPAALPEVTFATLAEDLARRDFSVNAMAASLLQEDFGRLLDPFGGRADLAGRVVRVLHDRSFVDDPTRIFRAIRYENRYGLRMDDATVGLAKAAVAAGLVHGLSGARVREELVALLAERDVAHTLERLAELGADRAIHPALAADSEAARLVARLDELKEELAVDVPDWRLRLAALAREVPAGEIDALLERLGLRRADAKQVAAAVIHAPRLVERLGAAEGADPAEVAELAEPHAPDAPLLALALADVPALRHWFARLRGIRLEITGADLAELGLPESPRVGEVLGELRRRKLRGELDGRDAELAAARDLIRE